MNRRELLKGAAIASAFPASLVAAAPASRGEKAYQVRMAAARLSRAAAESVANGDERPSYALMYSKGLPHNALGEVDPQAYDLLLHALRTGDAHDFDRVPCAGPMKLTNPQAGLAFDLEGPDAQAVTQPPAPR